MARGQQKIQSQKKAQERAEEKRRREGQPGQQKRVAACMTVQCLVKKKTKHPPPFSKPLARSLHSTSKTKKICKQPFMGSTTEAELRAHADSRHPKNSFDSCFADWREQVAKFKEIKATK